VGIEFLKGVIIALLFIGTNFVQNAIFQMKGAIIWGRNPLFDKWILFVVFMIVALQVSFQKDFKFSKKGKCLGLKKRRKWILSTLILIVFYVSYTSLVYYITEDNVVSYTYGIKKVYEIEEISYCKIGMEYFHKKSGPPRGQVAYTIYMDDGAEFTFGGSEFDNQIRQVMELDRMMDIRNIQVSIPDFNSDSFDKMNIYEAEFIKWHQ